ncbi:MAG: hypothetical protein Q9227_000413 [Pyrenula ochraceoflavens]
MPNSKHKSTGSVVPEQQKPAPEKPKGPKYSFKNLSKEGRRQDWSGKIQYQPLSRGGVRLLLVHPADENHEVICSLASLDYIPSDLHHNTLATSGYDALSYVWGDSKALCQVKCSDLGLLTRNQWRSFQLESRIPPALDRGFIEVTESLKVTLVRLRNARNVRVLWVDAVCIFQSHISERNEQIRIMYEIYKNARQVVIWLGDETRYSELAFSAMQILAEHKGPNITHVPRRAWDAMVYLLSHPWFTRTWVFQEAIANSSVTIQQGRYKIRWETLQQVMRAGLSRIIPTNSDPRAELGDYNPDEIDSGVGSDGNPFNSLTRYDMGESEMLLLQARWVKLFDRLAGQEGGDDKAISDIPRTTFCMIESIQEARLHTHRLTLKHLLPLLRHARATDAKDKVYALISLAMDSTVDLFPTVDYARTVREVYITAAIYWLGSGSNVDLGFLNHVQRDHKAIDNLPSWVPDWSILAAPVISEDRALYVEFKDTGSYNFDTPRPSAKGKISYDNDLEHSQPSLQVAMIRLMIIAKIDTSQFGVRRYVPIIGARRVKKPYPMIDSPYLWAFECLMRQWPTAHSFSEQPFWDYYHHGRPTDGLYRLIETKAPNEDDFQKVLEKESDLYRFDTKYHRAFFVTENGFIGLGPLSARSGDIVCQIFGMRTPAIIRKIEDQGNDSHYHFVGECWVAGIMHEEIYNGLPSENIETISLV